MKRIIVCIMCLILLCACRGTVSCPAGESTPAGPEPEKAELGELEYAQYSYGEAYMSVGLPEGWEYAIVEYSEETYFCGIEFWPAEYPDAKLRLLYYSNFFGVCGTGLEQQERTLALAGNVHVGTYDGRNVWDFIRFTEKGDNYALLNEAAEVWDIYGPQIDAILDTISLG